MGQGGGGMGRLGGGGGGGGGVKLAFTIKRKWFRCVYILTLTIESEDWATCLYVYFPGIDYCVCVCVPSPANLSFCSRKTLD